MQKIIAQALAPNSLLHGLLVAALVAFGGIITPILSNQNLPTEAQLLLAAKAAVAAGMGYLLKNGLFGSSQTNNSTNP